MIVRLKIAVNKIDKARLFKGQKDTYLDATLFINDQPDSYGNDGMITQDVTKEERESGVKGAILGNCKIVGGQQRQAAPRTHQKAPVSKPASSDWDESDPIPY